MLACCWRLIGAALFSLSRLASRRDKRPRARTYTHACMRHVCNPGEYIYIYIHESFCLRWSERCAALMGPIIHTLPFATQLSSSSMYAYTYTPIYVCIYTCVEKREDGAHSDWSRPRGARRGSLTFAKRRARALHSLAAHIYAACTRVYICMQPERERERESHLAKGFFRKEKCTRRASYSRSLAYYTKRSSSAVIFYAAARREKAAGPPLLSYGRERALVALSSLYLIYASARAAADGKGVVSQAKRLAVSIVFCSLREERTICLALAYVPPVCIG